MEKKLTLTFAMLFCIIIAHAQVAEYFFTQQQLTYTEITGGTVLWSNTFDNEISDPISIPSFTFNKTDYTSLYVSANGFITFGAAPLSTNYQPINNSSTSHTGVISAFACNLTQAGQGTPEVRYQQVGNEFVIQWKDVGRYNTTSDRISFQIRLNSSNSNISIVYGGTINPGSSISQPQVGLRGENTQDFNSRRINYNTGNWINSSKSTNASHTMYFDSSNPATVPSPGLTYSWFPLFNPSDFTANAIDLNKVNLSWEKNSSNNNVLLVVHNSPYFIGAPENGTSYPVGSTTPDYATVIYSGGNTSFQHINLNPGTGYHYKIWSYDAALNYSTGVITSCYTGFAIPYTQNFNSPSMPPGWRGNMSPLNSHGTAESYALTKRINSVEGGYAITPVMGPVQNNHFFSFHYRIIDYFGYPELATTLEPGNKIDIKVSTNNGETYSTIYTIDHTNHIASTYFSNKFFDLSSFNSSFIEIKFDVTWTSGDYYFDLDNVLIESGKNMSYSGAIVEQPNVSMAGIGTANNEIIRLNVITNKPDNPLSVTSINFNTNGSTNASNDIAAAKVFYTTEPVFSTATQFGTTQNNPSGPFTITGNQPLSGSNNYFWLAYDIKSTATPGNDVDAQCLKFKITSSPTEITPTKTNPPGNRKLGNPISGVKNIPGDFGSIAAAVNALNSGFIGEGGVTFQVAAGHTEQSSSDILLTASGTATRPIIFKKHGAGANPLVTRTDAGTVNGYSAGDRGDGIIIIQGGDYITFDAIDVKALFPGIDYGYYLRKESPTDGCKHVTIKNCNITMNKGEVRLVSGIHLSNNGQNTNQVSITSPSGAHSFITFTGNTIKNVYFGIYMKGHSTYYDNDIVIGTELSPNTIQDFGSSSSHEAHGIYIENAHNTDVGYNNINNTAGGGTEFSYNGYGISNKNSNQGSINIHHNTITLTSKKSIFYGIYNTGNGISKIEFNTINLSNTENGTFSAYFISNNPQTVSTSNLYINNNIFEAGNLSSNQAIYLINNSNNYNSPAVTEIKNNKVNGSITNTGTSMSFHCYVNSNNNRSGTEYILENDFTGITLTNSSTFWGISTEGTSNSVKYINDNIISDINGHKSFYGIRANSSSTFIIYDNTISGINNNEFVHGISYGSSDAVLHIHNNLITDITANTQTGNITGIYISGASTAYIYNNFISDLKTPSSGRSDAITGAYLSSTQTNSFIGFYYNTIYINAQTTSTTLGTTGILHIANSISTTGLLDMRNNIIVNTSEAKGNNNYTSALRRSNYFLGNFSDISNNNILYAGEPGPKNVIYRDVNLYKTLDEYKTYVAPRESNSFSENPPFVNISTIPFDLHLKTEVSTLAEGGGQQINTPIAITVDYDGDPRSGTNPDIGADEFDGISNFLEDPASFTAVALDSQSIKLEFEVNTDSDDVVIVFNGSGNFTQPEGPPVLEQQLANGEVLYIGKTSPVIHSGLNLNQTVYYRAFSYTGAIYSQGLSASAKTFLGDINNFKAKAIDQNKIHLSWDLNPAQNGAIIAAHTGNISWTPTQGVVYNVGFDIPGGGKIIYKGSSQEFDHTSLNPWTQYYYICFSYDNFNHYSSVEEANDITYSTPVTSFPYIMNFDGVWSHSPQMPENWNIIGGVISTWARALTHYRSQPASAKGSGTGNCENYLISPPFVLPQNEILLSWWDKTANSSASYKYKVLLSTTDKEISSFTTELGDYVVTNTGWTKHTINLANYAGQTVYIAFYHYYSGSFEYFVIDDIVLETELPVAATLKWPIDNIKTFKHPVELAWSPPVSNYPIIGYEVYLGSSPSTMVLKYDGPNTEYEIPDLSYDEVYYWKVVPYNNAGYALNVPVWSFSTIKQNQLAESFETGLFPPAGWDYNENISQYANWRIAVLRMHGLFSAGIETYGLDAKLQTPMLSIENGNTLSFFARTNTSSYGTIRVYSSEDKIAWSAVGDEIVIQPDAWAQYNLDLSSLHGVDCYLGIVAYPGESSTNQIFIDHIIGPQIKMALPHAATTPKPKNNETWVDLSPLLSWTPGKTGGIPSGYKVYVGTNGGGTQTPNNLINGTLVSSMYFDLPILLAGTKYYWQIIPTNSVGDADNCPIWSFETIEPNSVRIGFGNDDSWGLPIEPLVGYSFSQTIYTQEEINISNQWINKIYYQWNGDQEAINSKDWVIYMGHTNKTKFNNGNSWVPVEEMIKVFDGVVIIPQTPQWIEIVLDPPFKYNNVDNLVVAVGETTPFWDEEGWFLGTKTANENRSLSWYDILEAIDPYDPGQGDPVTYIPNTGLKFTSTPPPSILNIDRNMIDFGVVKVRTTSEQETIVLQNTGGGTLNINSIEITGADKTHFSIINPPSLPKSLETYEKLNVKVAFSPKTKGEKNAQIKIKTNQPSNSTYYIDITGIGKPIDDPQEFTAEPIDFDKIELSWIKNLDGNDVIIAFNINENIGELTEGQSYTVNQTLTGGGTVLYKGNLTTFVHTNLTEFIPYYYKIWSVNQHNNYSDGLMVSASTFCNTVVDLPINEDFENIHYTSLPVCWRRFIDSNESGKHHTVGVSFRPDDHKKKALMFYNDYEDELNSYLIMPKLNASIKHVMVSFDYYFQIRDMSIEGLTIGVMSNPGDPSTFVRLYPTQGALGTTWNWEKITYNFNEYHGNAEYIAFRAHFHYSSMHYIYLDNLKIDYIPACIPPRNPEVINTTKNTATVDWEKGFNENKWDIKYGSIGFNPETQGTPIIGITSKPYVITSLTPGTEYEFYVRANCNQDERSDWVGPVPFATQCNAVESPVIEDFETTPDWRLPMCWSVLKDSMSGYYIYNAPAAFGSYLELYSYGPYNKAAFISPQLSDNMAELYISFYASHDSYFPQTLSLGIMNGPTNINSFQEVEVFTISKYWEQYSYSFYQNGTNKYIAFKVEGYNIVNIDNIIIDKRTNCQQPAMLRLNNASSYTAEFTWHTVGIETSWEMRYGPAGFNPETGGLLITDITSKPYTITGLNPSTDYDVYIRSVCNETTKSAWTGPLTFTTFCGNEQKCIYTLDLYSLDYGWQGTVLGFKQKGIIVETFGDDFDSGSIMKNVEIPLCPDLQTQIVVKEIGFYSYTGDIGFKVFNPAGQMIFQKEPGEPFGGSEIFYEFVTECGTKPPNTYLGDITVQSGQIKCFDAPEMIFIAGNGKYFIVQNQATADLIAGQAIVMFPGTHFMEGSNVHVYIDLNGNFCSSLKTIVTNDDFYQEKTDMPDTGILNDSHSFFKLYPNPTTGQFTLEMKESEENQPVRVEIYNILGETEMNLELPVAKQYVFDLSAKKRGIYIVRVIQGKETGTEKIIIH
ncbi:MAG: choice-of-anchor J domain-containing protein [Bacteroidales bacterium]